MTCWTPHSFSCIRNNNCVRYKAGWMKQTGEKKKARCCRGTEKHCVHISELNQNKWNSFKRRWPEQRALREASSCTGFRHGVHFEVEFYLFYSCSHLQATEQTGLKPLRIGQETNKRCKNEWRVKAMWAAGWRRCALEMVSQWSLTFLNWSAVREQAKLKHMAVRGCVPHTVRKCCPDLQL